MGWGKAQLCNTACAATSLPEEEDAGSTFQVFKRVQGQMNKCKLAGGAVYAKAK